MTAKLTAKQRRFVEAFAGPAKGNATEAARMAGYSAKTARQMGQENLSKPAIAEAIDRLSQAPRAQARLDREKLNAWLEGVVLGEECEKPVITMAGPVKDEHGNQVYQAPDARDRVAAAKLLAQIRGYTLKPNVVREQLQRVKPRMTPGAYRELLEALADA